MPARGHVGPPHITKPKDNFNALDMFAQLTTLTTPTTAGDAMLYENGDTMLYEDGDTMVYE